MEHEVFVPVPVDAVRRALTEPARIARCLPGLQPDDDAGPADIAGRLRLRIGGSSITYRGVLHIAEQDGHIEYAGEGTEARGGVGVSLTLAVDPQPADGGTVLHCAGELETAAGASRLTEFDAEQVAAAARRLLDRFGEELATELADERASDGAGESTPSVVTADSASGAAPSSRGADSATDSDSDTAPAPASASDADAGAGSASGPGPEQGADAAARDTGGGTDTPAEVDTDAEVDTGAEVDTPAEVDTDASGGADSADGARSSLFETEVPPSSVDPLVLGEAETEEPPAEAAHARRTMIGRSAEEVDHAPPRGRYAPVPAPETASTVATLRWAAPAAAAVLASAVVVSRVLRRRK